jgi:flagella basal body P-ring formation protein FlgA
VLERTFQTVVRQRAGLATAAGTLPKDAVLSEADIRTEERWLPPGQAREASAERLIGQALRRRIDSGKPIGAQDVASPIVARRGQDLWVHCLSGPLVIKTKAKAMSDARDGELVRVQMEGSSKTLTARMSGPGKAVMNIDADDSGSMP